MLGRQFWCELEDRPTYSSVVRLPKLLDNDSLHVTQNAISNELTFLSNEK